jgi:hypothetical protein
MPTKRPRNASQMDLTPADLGIPAESQIGSCTMTVHGRSQLQRHPVDSL